MAGFNNGELTAHLSFWQRVVEDDIPFDIDVTIEFSTSLNKRAKSTAAESRWGFVISPGAAEVTAVDLEWEVWSAVRLLLPRTSTALRFAVDQVFPECKHRDSGHRTEILDIAQMYSGGSRL